MKSVFFVLMAIVVSSVAQAKYSGGSGSANDPYLLATVADLLMLGTDTSDYNKCFAVAADINLDPNLPGGQVFSTAVIARDISNSNYIFDGVIFTGTFDGGGHKITKLTINSSGVGRSFLGLFGNIGAGGVIKNLGVENVSIVGSDTSYCVGGLAAQNKGGSSIVNCYSTGNVRGWRSVGGLSGENDGNIINCYSGCNTAGVGGCWYVGGLVGDNLNGSIIDCHSTGNVSGGNGSWALGGLVGTTSRGDINNCFSTGSVIAGDYSSACGGIVGDNEGNVSNSYATGDVNGVGDSYCIGGLVGWNFYGNVSNCYATGNVFGMGYIGGLVGDNGSYDAGIYDGYSTISKCYSAGYVIERSLSSDHRSRLVGANEYGSISNCYFLVVGVPDGSFATPLSDTQMRQRASFAGWDFVGETVNGTKDIWRMCVDMVNYPLLWWQFDAGDFACPDGVDFRDFSVLSRAWMSNPTQVNWNPKCDIAKPSDNIIDIQDLMVMCDNWLEGL